MASTQLRSIGFALGRLRLAVAACCWMVGIALALQLLVWSLATFTDMRYETPVEAVTEGDAPLVVTAESSRQQRIRNAREAEMGVDLSDAPPPAAPELELSRNDRIFEATVQFSGAIGRCAMLALLPLMMVGVMLSASSATPGVDRVVSSLVWALIAAVFILPLGEAFSLPWQHGALTTYDHVIGWVDQMEPASGEVDNEQAASTLMFYGRLGLLPAACLVGITLVGLRFCSGVEAGILAGENMRLDPALEREAANISPSSLHAGRSTGALGQTMRSAAPNREENIPSATAVSPGERPQRLI